ncbi:MAG: TatD family hydrolase [Leptospiraceae bacterium]|nr:TatD family hydrolase [Leptospiraceae bacterium]MCP5498763.1 TatD family hydrolase [Leptospiraceae bacterium]
MSIDISQDIIPDINSFSIGLHPWKIKEENLSHSLFELRNFIQHKNCLAVGEAGLDRLKGPDLEIQINALKEQIKLSEEFSIPLILHCVRAFPELFYLKKNLKPKNPWILHGFTAGKEIAKEAIKKGILLSFGSALLKEKVKILQYFSELPLDSIFFETDEDKVSIIDIYKKASGSLQIPQDTLELQIEKNFKKVFRYEL